MEAICASITLLTECPEIERNKKAKPVSFALLLRSAGSLETKRYRSLARVVAGGELLGVVVVGRTRGVHGRRGCTLSDGLTLINIGSGGVVFPLIGIGVTAVRKFGAIGVVRDFRHVGDAAHRTEATLVAIDDRLTVAELRVDDAILRSFRGETFDIFVRISLMRLNVASFEFPRYLSEASAGHPEAEGRLRIDGGEVEVA